MIKSMTGYACKEVTLQDTVISVEIRSVNSRFLDLEVNLPVYLNPLENYYKSLVTARVFRGKVSVYIKVKQTNSDAKITADTAIAREYFNAIKDVASATGLACDSQVLSLLINLPGVLNVDNNYDLDKFKLLIDPVFEQVLCDFCNDRIREGENLKKDLDSKIDRLFECQEFFAEWQPKMEEAFKKQISDRFNELLGEAADQNRIMTETAAMLVKYTINEEIVRLKSHLSAMKEELQNSSAPGKKLDFICQEANREINTIGSKNQFSQVGAMVITAKDCLENIREQAKNVE